MPQPICTFGGEPSTVTSPELHSIPARIEYTGPANVSGHFIQENDGVERAAFRGKGLEGCDVAILEGYKLYAMKKREGNREIYDVDGKYEKFKVWEWDKIVEDGSRTAFSKAMGYLKIAEALAKD